MSYSTFRVLLDLLKHKYSVPEGTSYFESIEIMKKNGLSTEELIALHEVWGDYVEEQGL